MSDAPFKSITIVKIFRLLCISTWYQMDDCADALICINKDRLPSRGAQVRRQLGKLYGSLHNGSVSVVDSFNS